MLKIVLSLSILQFSNRHNRAYFNQMNEKDASNFNNNFRSPVGKAAIPIHSGTNSTTGGKNRFSLWNKIKIPISLNY